MKMLRYISFFVCLSLAVQAAVVFEDDFNQVDPLDDPVAIVGTWTVAEDDPNGIQVIDDLVPGGFDGDRYLRLHRWSTVPEEGGGIRANAIFSQTVTDQLTVTFALFRTSGEQMIWILDSSSDSVPEGYEAIDSLVKLYIAPDGRVQHSDIENGRVDTGLRVNDMEWHVFRLTVNMASQSYSVWLNGQEVSGLSFFFPFPTSAKKVVFYNMNTAMPALFYIDKLLIESGTPTCTEMMAADFNADCKVDIQDLVMLVENWLASYLL